MSSAIVADYLVDGDFYLDGLRTWSHSLGGHLGCDHAAVPGISQSSAGCRKRRPRHIQHRPAARHAGMARKRSGVRIP